MPTQANLSPLAGAALALVGTGVTPSDLVARLAANEAAVEERVAKARLDELCDLGLARAAPAAGRTMYYVTPLGERLLSMSFSADPRHADLLAVSRRCGPSSSRPSPRAPDAITSVRRALPSCLTGGRAQLRAATLAARDDRTQREPDAAGSSARSSTSPAYGPVAYSLQLRRFNATELARSAIASVARLPSPGVRDRTGRTAERCRSSATSFGSSRRYVNLLSNAEKYSPAVPRSSSPWRRRTARCPGRSPTGATGFRPEVQARLFERFFVASIRETEAATGIGLGFRSRC